MCPGFVATEISLNIPTRTRRRSDCDPAADREFKTPCAETHAGRARGLCRSTGRKRPFAPRMVPLGSRTEQCLVIPRTGPGAGAVSFWPGTGGAQHTRGLRFPESRLPTVAIEMPHGVLLDAGAAARTETAACRARLAAGLRRKNGGGAGAALAPCSLKTQRRHSERARRRGKRAGGGSRRTAVATGRQLKRRSALLPDHPIVAGAPHRRRKRGSGRRLPSRTRCGPDHCKSWQKK